MRRRRESLWLRSYQRRFAHQIRHPVCAIRAPYIDLRPMSDLRGGIDLGGTKIQTAVIDTAGEVKGEARRPTPTDGGPKDVAAAMSEALVEAAKAAGVESSELQGIGVGSPGDVDEKAGTVSSARNLPDWEGTFKLGEALEKELGATVRIGNDVQVATEAEFHLGAGKDF